MIKVLKVLSYVFLYGVLPEYFDADGPKFFNLLEKVTAWWNPSPGANRVKAFLMLFLKPCCQTF